jgi:hypothetical protein
MKQIKFNNVKSREDIETTILAALKYDELVDNDEAAEQWFKDAGMEGDVHHNVILSTHVRVWNEEMQGEETYNVIVKEHYIDSGSVDYVYSYSIR